MTPKKIPQFIADQYAYGARGFRQEQRWDLKEAMKYIRLARRGCAYSPAFEHIKLAETALKAAIEAVKVKNWDRRLQGKPEQR